jgi:hypothetical protein
MGKTNQYNFNIQTSRQYKTSAPNVVLYYHVAAPKGGVPK